jgi:hypothetical protein
MTTSGTYNFAPGAGELVLNAFAQCCLRRAELTTEHWADAAVAFGLLMADMSNRNPHQFALETVPQVLEALTAAYTLPARVLAIAIAYIDTTDATGATTSRVIGPISATEYAAIPSKGDSGPPTSYWFNLQEAAPVITLYPVPDAATTYTMRVVTFRQLQDVTVSSGVNVDVPFRFLDAVTTGLAARLADMYPEKLVKQKGPQAIDRLYAQYEAKFNLAARRDQENVPMFISPGLDGYYR